MRPLTYVAVREESPILTQARIAAHKQRRAALALANDGLRRVARPGPRRMVFTGTDAQVGP